MDYLRQFDIAIREIGLVSFVDLRTDGRIGRCGTTEKPNGKDGSYIIHLDEPINGWAKNYITGIEINWKPDREYPITERDKQYYDRLRDIKKRETEWREKEAIKEVKLIISNASEPNPDNAYIKKKKIDAIGALQDNVSLIIPLYRLIADKLETVSLQRIYNNGDKRYHSSISTSGLFHIFGDINSSGLIYIAEGYATGVTIYKAVSRNIPVVCAMSIGNLENVVKILLDKYPNLDIVIAADNDEKEGKLNIGLDTAKKIAEINEQSYCYPCISGDFNDLYCIDNNYIRVQECLLNTVSYRISNDIYRKEGEIGFTRGNAMRLEAPKWLWEGRLLRGDINLLAGHPSTGKSTISIDLAARITSGGSWPNGTVVNGVGNVGILSSEDSPERTILPRYIAAGGNIEKIYIMESCITEKEITRTINIKTDIDKIERFCKRIKPILIIIDPITSYLGDIDTHKTSDVRGALEPLSRLAKMLDISFLIVTHFNKGSSNTSGQSAIERITGSNALVALSRIAWITIMEKKEDEEGESINLGSFLNAKCNVAKEPTGLEYEIESYLVNDMVDVGKIKWKEETYDDINIKIKEKIGKEDKDISLGKLNKAKEWLLSTLTNGIMSSSSIIEEGEKVMFSRRTLFRAKKELNIKAKKINNIWYWSISNGEIYD